ncbi:hypothetical protein ACQY0O_003602 [Thecaphora frezii]
MLLTPSTLCLAATLASLLKASARPVQILEQERSTSYTPAVDCQPCDHPNGAVVRRGLCCSKPATEAYGGPTNEESYQSIYSARSPSPRPSLAEVQFANLNQHGRGSDFTSAPESLQRPRTDSEELPTEKVIDVVIDSVKLFLSPRT